VSTLLTIIDTIDYFSEISVSCFVFRIWVSFDGDFGSLFSLGSEMLYFIARILRRNVAVIAQSSCVL